jgi:membrane associated rhomboid family serine protease
MFQRRTSGSVVCPSCGSLVGVRDDRCYSCGRANPGLWGFAPLLRQLGRDLGFVPLVIGASSVLYVLTLLASGPNLRIAAGGINFLVPSQHALLLFGMTGALPVFYQGAWWTLLSASWLHGSALHILFNMMWVRDLGPTMADVIGPSRTVIIYTVSGVCGFVLSSVAGLFVTGVPFTIGASASVFGLLGALVHYGRKSGSTLIRGQAMNYAVILFVMGFLMSNVDNFAHAGGFAGGYLASAFFNPLTRERGDHLLMAVLCLAATFLAVAASLLVNSGLVR